MSLNTLVSPPPKKVTSSWLLCNHCCGRRQHRCPGGSLWSSSSWSTSSSSPLQKNFSAWLWLFSWYLIANGINWTKEKERCSRVVFDIDDGTKPPQHELGHSGIYIIMITCWPASDSDKLPPAIREAIFDNTCISFLHGNWFWKRKKSPVPMMNTATVKYWLGLKVKGCWGIRAGH